MNWKVLCLIPLTLAMPAYANTNSNNQITSSAVVIAQSNQQGGSMMNGGSMMKPGAMMNGGGSMMKPGAMMGMGSRGDSVEAAQSFLTGTGFYTGPINGIFDNETRAAVVKFQNSKKITPTGIIGPTTRSAMQF